MRRLNDLNPETRLRLIEEAYLQYDREYVYNSISNNALVISMCDWAITRQGAEYWCLISGGIL